MHTNIRVIHRIQTQNPKICSMLGNILNWNQHFLTSPQSLVNSGKINLCSVQRIWRYTGETSLPGQFGAMVRDGGGSMCGNSSQKAWLPSETGCSPFLAHLGHCRDQSPSWHDYFLRTFIWWVNQSFSASGVLHKFGEASSHSLDQVYFTNLVSQAVILWIRCTSQIE